MGELTGGMIQMNAKLVMSGCAKNMAVIGALFGTSMLIVAVVWWFEEKRRWWAWLMAALLLAGLAYWGTRLPREKIIHACACGPVSLEQVAVRYDIIEVDGKELVLRVR